MTEPNAEQVRYWNEVAGPRWVRFQEGLDRQLAALAEAALGRAAPAPGEAVLDVGCGCGATTLELGRRVGGSGRALGVDISRPMLERARARAQAAGGAGRLRRGRRADGEFEAGAFDLLFSRFGVMFFTDPAAAFANLRRALRPGGRVAFLCWQRFADNPWMLVPLGAVAQHVSLPLRRVRPTRPVPSRSATPSAYAGCSSAPASRTSRRGPAAPARPRRRGSRRGGRVRARDRAGFGGAPRGGRRAGPARARRPCRARGARAVRRRGGTGAARVRRVDRQRPQSVALRRLLRSSAHAAPPPPLARVSAPPSSRSAPTSPSHRPPAPPAGACASPSATRRSKPAPATRSSRTASSRAASRRRSKGRT